MDIPLDPLRWRIALVGYGEAGRMGERDAPRENWRLDADRLIGTSNKP